ncbi:MAG: FliA/WhiG family RNA polymerase sigma factor [Verrucomicrobia bacterium]|nr:FliA/WhiG family RNA polymerase sigma factor [Verrucomicrobiota bacterium]
MSPTVTSSIPGRTVTPTQAAASTAVDEREFQARVERHQPLVRSIVDRMKRKLPQTIEPEELYSVGVTGLVAAARNYRASQAGSFAGYAATRIRGAVLDELRRMDWMSRCSRSKAKRLGVALSRLEQEQGGAVDQESLCAELQMSEDELQELMDEMRPARMVSLDSPNESSSEPDERSLHDIIADDFSASAYEVVERKEMVALLANRIAQMPEIPRKVLAMYYYENLRLADIAACFGLTESRICQIHTQAVKQLRAYLLSVLS